MLAGTGPAVSQLITITSRGRWISSATDCRPAAAIDPVPRDSFEQSRLAEAHYDVLAERDAQMPSNFGGFAVTCPVVACGRSDRLGAIVSETLQTF